MKPLSLYLHWPFCLSKCPYCDFNSHVRAHIEEDRWRKALETELSSAKEYLPNRQVNTIFFGGGTPSLMSPQTVEKLLDSIHNLWPLASNTEITLEANPNTFEAHKFRDFRKVGINRLSLGIQSLIPEDLKFLGRSHNREEALEALTATATLFDNYSFDLIYARPGQTLEAWKQELTEALTYARNHISLYQLTIEPGTAFYTAYQRQAFQLPENEAAADLYEFTHELLDHRGLKAYEISNHARVGFECQHNLAYWRYDDYLGVGPGAHGRLTLSDGQKYELKRIKAPETWLAQVEQKGHGTDVFIPIAQKERFIEMLMMGLRLTQGISLKKIHEEMGVPLQDLLPFKTVAPLCEEGLLEITEMTLKATSSGRQRLNSLLTFLIEKSFDKKRKVEIN